MLVDYTTVSYTTYISVGLADYEIFCFAVGKSGISNSYTMACPPVRELASRLSYVQVDIH